MTEDKDTRIAALEAQLAAISPAPEAQQEPVAWTGSGSMRALEIGMEGYIWPTKAAAHPIPLFARPLEQAVTEEGIEAAARIITKWLGYSWDGLLDGRVTDRGFPVFTHDQFGWGFQGRKGDMIDLARAALKAAMEAKE